MFGWVGFDLRDINRVRHDVVVVLGGRLRGGKCLLGWVVATSRVFVRCWLRFDIDDDYCVCG